MAGNSGDRLIAGLLAAVWAAGLSIAAGPPSPALGEYQVKAAFLYNFARFAEWPAESFQHSGEVFQVCVLGTDPFGPALDEVTAGQSVAGHPVEVRRISDPAMVRGCRLLFLGGSQKRLLSSALREPGVLTVADSDCQGAGEAMIWFTVDRGKVRFEINMDAATRGKVRLSSRLLSLATAVRR